MAYRADSDGWNDPIEDPTGGYGAAPTQGGTAAADPVVANQIQLLYQQFLGRGASPQEIQDWIKGSNGGNYLIIRNGIEQSDEAKAYKARQQQPVTPPTTGGGAPPPTGSIGAMDPSAVFQPPQVTGLPSWMPQAPAPPPGVDLPTFAKPAPYQEPNYADALNDKGYQFEASEGQRQMEQSAAARGVLNGGGTLKDINAWGQNFASQRVNDVRDRSVNNYLLNYQTQYTDPYKYAYQKAMDTFTGGLNLWQGQNSQYQTQAQVGQRNAEDVWQQAYTPFNDLWNRRITVGLS